MMMLFTFFRRLEISIAAKVIIYEIKGLFGDDIVWSIPIVTYFVATIWIIPIIRMCVMG